MNGVMMLFIIDVNEKIKLRMLTAKDAEALYLITDQSRGYLKKWLPWLDDIKSVDDSMQFIKNSFQLYHDLKGITAGVFVQDTLVGVIGFNHIDRKNKIGSIGYWLGERYQGKGIMTEAVSALVTHGFTRLGLNRIELRAATDNKPSRAIAERLHFKKEGIIRQAEWLYDKYVDHVVYGLLREDWQRR